MFRMLAAVVLVLAPVGANAAECSHGSPDVLQIVDWSAVTSDGVTEVQVAYRNIGTQLVKMSDGSVWFYDALGDSIGGINLNRDPKLPPGQVLTETFRMRSMQRLAIADKSDLEAIICVEDALFDDGSKLSDTSGPEQLNDSLANEIGRIITP